MVGTQHLLRTVHCLAAEALGLVLFALLLEQLTQVPNIGQRVRVPVAERLAARLQILANQRLRLLQLALGLQQLTVAWRRWRSAVPKRR